MKWFKFGTDLAIQQDILFDFIKDLNVIKCPSEVNKLRQNLWVWLSYRIAPSNLVIRQYCIIDILSKDQNYRNKIIWLLKKLAPYDEKNKRFWNKDACIWLEGYSYWLYVKHFLCLYVEKFKDEEISKYIARVDRGFVYSAYRRNNYLAPAPFGDLRDIPLEESLQNEKELFDVNLFPVFKFYDTIYVDRYYLGFNSHVPHETYTSLIDHGYPIGFKYYTGFQNKYNNIIEEFLDMVRPKKIWSAVKLVFERKP
ncbi:MAG: hypothetical protein ACOC2U_00565 [bacterium]